MPRHSAPPERTTERFSVPAGRRPRAGVDPTTAARRAAGQRVAAVTRGPQPAPEAVRARRDRRVPEVVGAVAALLLVTGLIVRGSVGLYHPADERIVAVGPRTGEVLSGEVELRSGVTAPLFDDVHLAPGDVRSECIAIDYRGDVDVDSVVLQLSDTAGSAQP